MTVPNQQQEDQGPWYREPWAWFVLTPLIVVVISCSITVTIALKNADDRVVDNYYKEGRMINARMDEDVRAADLGISAELAFDQELQELIIRLQSEQTQYPEALRLVMSHVSDQSLDHEITLKHIAKGHYQAELSQPLQYRWYVRLHPAEAVESVAEQPWRLRGDINFAANSRVQLSANH